MDMPIAGGTDWVHKFLWADLRWYGLMTMKSEIRGPKAEILGHKTSLCFYVLLFQNAVMTQVL